MDKPTTVELAGAYERSLHLFGSGWIRVYTRKTYKGKALVAR